MSEIRRMPRLERKFMGSELHALGHGAVWGYASRFGEADRGGDVVRPRAFRRSLERMSAEGRAVRFLWQHDPARPIGVWDRVVEDAVGLRVEGRMLDEVAAGAEALALLSAGAIDGLSIGYRTVRAEPNPETGGRFLVELDLWEVSLVTFPMLPTARASIRPGTAAELLAGVLAGAMSDGARRTS